MTPPVHGNAALATRSAHDTGHLYLHLLGDVQLYWAGELLPWPGPKPLAVLVYLHLKGGATREELAEVFWPTKDGAHQNVRQALTTLRRLGGSTQWLHEDRSSITLTAVSDVSELLRLQHADPDVALPFAVGTGTILDRLATPSPVFEAWLDDERRRLCTAQVRVLQAAGVQLTEAGEYDRARNLLRQAMYMEHQVDSEATYRALMLLEHRAGRTAQALEVFEECRRMLESELDAEPDAETLALLQVIEERPGGATRRGTLLTADTLALPEDEPLLGRQRERAQVLALLSQGRRVLLHGLGGLGKTRLARDVARHVTRDGGAVAWLEVGGDAAPMIVTGLRDVLRAPPSTSLGDALREARVGLVVLDNAVNTYAAQQALLQLPEDVPVLVTSRLRLPNLTGVGLTRLPRAAALDLLAFHLSAHDTAHLGPLNHDSLCALLGDHPFAIRLAAHTLGRAASADVLRTLYDAPHDTVRALLEQSVSQLEPRPYEAYLGLGSLYAPQATPELLAQLLDRPTEEVTQALFHLVERGLLTRETRPGSDTLNFHMHDLTWHAAREHCAHLAHHLTAAVTAYAEAFTDSPDQLATDLPHLLGAASSAPDPHLRRLVRAWLGGQYIAARGFPTAYLHLLQRAIDGAEHDGDHDTASLLNGKYADIAQALLGDQGTAIDRQLRAAGQAGLAAAWGRQATHLALAGQMEAVQGRPEAFTHLSAAQALADRAGHPVIQARVLGQRAVASAVQKDFPQAHALLLEARGLLERALNDDPSDHAIWTAYLGTLSNLGQAEMRLGNLTGALDLKREVGRVAAERDDRLFMARAALDQGELLHQLAQPHDAMTHLQDAIRLSQGIGAGSLESMARHLLQNIASVQPTTDQP